MINLNIINGAAHILNYWQVKLASKFEKDLIGVEMGIAYGGGVEDLASIWKGRGKVYGFDTFEGHPDFLSKEKYSAEARCMDHWYNPLMFGTKALSYEFQRDTLLAQNLDNVTLIKGLINKDSCKDIPYIHYALLDLDLYESMKVAYKAVRDKFVTGGYLFLHDVLPDGHLPLIHDWWYKEVLPKENIWKSIGEWPNQFLAGFERI